MINKGNKSLAGAFFGFFIFFEVILLIFGEGIMIGHRVFLEIRIYSIVNIIISNISIILIFKDKTIGYLILILSMVIAFIVYFGHLMLWWPCDYCGI